MRRSTKFAGLKYKALSEAGLSMASLNSLLTIGRTGKRAFDQ